MKNADVVIASGDKFVSRWSGYTATVIKVGRPVRSDMRGEWVRYRLQGRTVDDSKSSFIRRFKKKE